MGIVKGEERSRLEYVPIDELKRWPKNPKFHNEEELCSSIVRFGFVAPFVVNESTGELVAGHGRLDALLRMKNQGDNPPKRIVEENGKWLAPVIRGIHFANEDEAAAYAIADNRLVEAGGWDSKATIDILLDMDSRHVPFEGMGLRPDDIMTLFADTEKVEKKEYKAEPDYVPAEPKTPVSARGDIWLCGKHKVMVGDCSVPDDLDRLLGNEQIQLIFTDPPYKQQAGGAGYCGRKPSMRKLDEAAISDYNIQQAAYLLSTIDPESAYFFCSKGLIREYIETFETLGRSWDLLVMHKHNPIPAKNNTFLSDIEWLFFSRKPGAYWNNDLPFECYFKMREVTVGASGIDHPTVKQVDFIEPYLKLSAKESDLILDPYAGSGTTMIAAERSGRVTRLMEINPVYVDVILGRWKEFSGESAILESTGQIFEEVAEGRGVVLDGPEE